MAKKTFTLGTAILAVLLATACGDAQSPLAQPGPKACPPDATKPPLTPSQSGRPLSDQLAESKGVICPPAGVDPQMQQKPPEGGAMKVIPPPGSPGGNPNVQPK